MSINTFSVLIYFLYILLYVDGNTNCKEVTSEKHYITAEDFVVTRIDEKYVLCAVYFCPKLPRTWPIQLDVYSISSINYTINVHFDQQSVQLTEKCGHCESNQTESDSNDNCEVCPQFNSSNSLEIHARFLKPSTFDKTSNKCSPITGFNISVSEFNCPNSISMNIANGHDCNISTITPLQPICVKPNCFNSMSVKNESQSFIHKFILMDEPQTCIWNVDVQSEVEITFSPELKNHLSFYEDNLMNLKQDLKNCNNTLEKVTFTPNSKRIIIVYKNEGSLKNESYIKVNMPNEELCSLPTTFENGNVEFVSENNETYVVFSCFENYYLVGEQQITCSDIKELLPECVEQKAPALPDSDESSKNNISIIELEEKHIASENVTSIEDRSWLESSEGSASGIDDDIPYEDINDESTNRTNLFETDDELTLLKLPIIETNTLILVGVGVVVLLVVLAGCAALLAWRGRKGRAATAGGRHNSTRASAKFDTFQNPIYEKAVVRVSIPVADSDDPSMQKLQEDMTAVSR